MGHPKSLYDQLLVKLNDEGGLNLNPQLTCQLMNSLLDLESEEQALILTNKVLSEIVASGEHVNNREVSK